MVLLAGRKQSIVRVWRRVDKVEDVASVGLPGLSLRAI